MRNAGKHNVLGILIDAVDYEAATRIYFSRSAGAARLCDFRPGGARTDVGAINREHKFRLNHFDLAGAGRATREVGAEPAVQGTTRRPRVRTKADVKDMRSRRGRGNSNLFLW